MTILSVALSAGLLLLGTVHLLWALGVWWPAREERRLVSAVVGVAGAERMPGPIPCVLVTAACILAASLPWWPPGGLRQAALVLAAGAFLLRGLMPWMQPWRRVALQEPFASLDRALYGPLCLLFSAGFLFLLLEADHQSPEASGSSGAGAASSSAAASVARPWVSAKASERM